MGRSTWWALPWAALLFLVGCAQPEPSPADGPEVAGVPEMLCDGLDNDGDGRIDDGFPVDLLGLPACSTSCPDWDPSLDDALCDGLDSACDGLPASERDADGDGYMPCVGDCDDANPEANPGGAQDTVCDGIDHDCGPGWELDRDGDGFFVCADDCADLDPMVHPGAIEVCDWRDNDCDGEIDEGPDLDGDGSGLCDCDDAAPAVFPAANELCDGVVNDCGGWNLVVDGDADGDGFGPCDGDCLELDLYSPDGLLSASIHPGAIEVCDGLDGDCDGAIDEGFDSDGDGLAACGFDGAYNTADDDCRDSDSTVPGPETCNGLDDDCDAVIDGGFDGDGDGATLCGPDGVVGTGDEDCDDAEPARRRGALDLPGDGIDADCDGVDATPTAAVPATAAELRAWGAALIEGLRDASPADVAPLGCATIPTTRVSRPGPATVSAEQPGWLSGVVQRCAAASGLRGTLSGQWMGSPSSAKGGLYCGLATASGAWAELPFAVGAAGTVSGSIWDLTSASNATAGCDYGCDSSSQWSGTDKGGELFVRRDAGDAPLWGLPEGVTVLDWAADRNSGYSWGQSCTPNHDASITADVTSHADGSPWVLSGSVAWSWEQDDGWGGPVGCSLEPASGSLTLTHHASPGAPADLMVELVLDSTCDGCNEWLADGGSLGLVCDPGLAW